MKNYKFVVEGRVVFMFGITPAEAGKFVAILAPQGGNIVVERVD